MTVVPNLPNAETLARVRHMDNSCEAGATPALIPLPRFMELREGKFTLDSAVFAHADSEMGSHALDLLRTGLIRLCGMSLASEKGKNGRSISLRTDCELTGETYQLTIGTSQVTITAGSASGFVYGVQTLLQCLPFDAAWAANEWKLPCLHVEDAPRFRWRGLMLDSVRHFQEPAFIERFLDLMALYKFNTLHWHLVDDQGWRIEIRRYPELTRIGAWRKESRVGREDKNEPGQFDGRPHGGFYTQDQLRHLVAYAAARGITIVPEVEMPGHASAAIAAYSELSCTGKQGEVETRWGIFDDVFCAGNDAVFHFLENVLDEVLDIFPSQFIHVGGDECRKTRWKECAKCRQRIVDENLADEHELQSWFVRHFDRFLTARGRRLIGWDEILEGGLAQNAAVMSWRGEEAGIEAATAGHDVVMAPHQKTYLDYYQSEDHDAEPLSIGGHLPLEKIYENGVIPAELDEAYASHVLGGQGQIWTEYMPRTDNIEYMVFPRACALAEILWSQPEGRDFAEFKGRLERHLRVLERMDVNYRPLF